MRALLAFILILLCSPARASMPKQTFVVIGARDMRDTTNVMTMTKVVFYRLPSDAQYTGRICLGMGCSTIDSFAPGLYRMAYQDVFDQERNDTITVPPVDTFYIHIALDSLPGYNPSGIDKLKEGEQINIAVLSQGCFHHSDRLILIERKKGLLRASLYDTDQKPLIRLSRKRRGKLLSRTTLDDNMIAAYTRFENELLTLDTTKGFCTTSEYYQVSGPYLNLSKSDAGCQWQGSRFLLRAFFKDTEW